MSYLENFQAEQEHIYFPISKECCWGEKNFTKMKDALTSTENIMTVNSVFLHPRTGLKIKDMY